jgi:hypothetical protein
MRTITLCLLLAALAGCTTEQLQAFDNANKALIANQQQAAPPPPPPPAPTTYNCSSQPGPGQTTVTCTPVW